MASWTASTPASTPQVKFENSPAESFVSTPGADMYPLFDTPAPSTMNPLESVMTPGSVSEEQQAESSPAPADGESPAPDGDKKPAKKRKSWGQVLPEPKTCLPPRKRAKTEDEKEQRRVERVLRNRRAAQSSRERKRQEVEALEKRTKTLEAMLAQQQKQNMMLLQELSKYRRSSGVVTRGSSPLDTLQPSPLTLSKPLFGASDLTEEKGHMMNDFILMPENEGTIDPASISPELTPVPDQAVPAPAPAAPAQAATPATTSTDVTQHPAAVLCDLQSSDAFDGLFGDDFSLSTSSHADGWGAQAQFSPSSDPLNFEYNHLDGDASGELQDFDFGNFLHDDISGVASGAIAGHVSASSEPEPSFGLFDSESQVFTDNLNQQSQTGASAQGCDAGIIAVGV